MTSVNNAAKALYVTRTYLSTTLRNEDTDADVAELLRIVNGYTARKAKEAEKPQ
jgi:hypothetical protein